MTQFPDPNSIVDYLKSKGQDSSLASRSALGKKYGVDYSATTDNYATQNTNLLNKLNPRDAYTANLTTATGNGTSTGTGTNTPAVGTATTPTTSPFDSYKTYLKQYTDSQQENPEITTARNDLNTIQTAGDRQGLDARKAYEDIIHQAGMLKGGAQEAGSVSNRNNSYILANLGVAESGASRKLSALTDAENAKMDFLKTQLDLSKPVQLGDKYFDPTTGKEITGVTNPKEKTGIAGEYEYAKQNGYTGSFIQYQNEDANRKKSIANPSTISPEDKEINSFQSDASKFIEGLGNGTVKWGTAWNALHAKYPQASNELLDQILNKAEYYPK